MKKIYFLICGIGIMFSDVFGEEDKYNSLTVLSYHEASLKNIILTLFDNETVIHHFDYGYSGVSPTGEISVRYTINQEEIEEIRQDFTKRFMTLDMDKSETLNFVGNVLLKVSDPESVYLGLYFLCEKADFTDKFLLGYIASLLEDDRPLIKTQIMWIISQCIQQGLFVDAACRFVLQEIKSNNPVMRMWALEILQELCNAKKLNISDVGVDLWTCYFKEKHPLIRAQLLFVLDFIYGVSKHATDIMTNLHQALKFLDEDVRYAGLYLLTKMDRYEKYKEFVEKELLIALQDTARIRMQAMWALSKFVRYDVFHDQAYEIAQTALVDEDWHIRLGGAILLKELYYNEEPFDAYKVMTLLEQCEKDESMFLQIYADI